MPCKALEQHGKDTYLTCFVKNGFCGKIGAYAGDGSGDLTKSPFAMEVKMLMKAGSMGS